MDRTVCYLTEQQTEGLSYITSNTGRSASELMRNAVDEYLNKHRYDQVGCSWSAAKSVARNDDWLDPTMRKGYVEPTTDDRVNELDHRIDELEKQFENLILRINRGEEVADRRWQCVN